MSGNVYVWNRTINLIFSELKCNLRHTKFAVCFPIEEEVGFQPKRRIGYRPNGFQVRPLQALGYSSILGIQSCQITSLQIYNFLFKKQIFYHYFSYLFVVGNISQVGIEQGISLPYLLDCD